MAFSYVNWLIEQEVIELCGWQEGNSWSIWLQELAIAIQYEAMWKFMRGIIAVWADSLNPA